MFWGFVMQLDSDNTYSIVLYGFGSVLAIYLTSAIVGSLESVPLVSYLEPSFLFLFPNTCYTNISFGWFSYLSSWKWLVSDTHSGSRHVTCFLRYYLNTIEFIF